MNLPIKKSLASSENYSSEDRPIDQDGWIYADWNEFLFNPSLKVLEQLRSFDKISRYPNNNEKKLIEALSIYTNFKQENISIYSGSDEALRDIFTTYLDNDKSAIVFNPTYNQVKQLILSNTNSLIESKINDPLEAHLYAFEEVEKADVVYLINPNNPTGKLLNPEKIEKLISSNKEKLFVIDEAYYEFSNNSLSPLIMKYDNLIITRTFSKAFGLAGLRIGYIITNKKIINDLKKIKNIKSVNSVATTAAISVMDNINYYKNCIAEVLESKEMFYKKINELHKLTIFRSEANFLIIKADDSTKLIDFLKEQKILVRNISKMYSLENCIRITLGSIESSEKILRHLAHYDQN
jgi:histidinol-phosphate aminotransferase